MSENKVLKINEADNVAIALVELKKDEVVTIDNKKISLKDPVPGGHKFSIKIISEDEDIIKYGFSIGKSKRGIKTGEHVHMHNLSISSSSLSARKSMARIQSR